MNRLPRLAFALLTPFVLAWSASSRAARLQRTASNLYQQADQRHRRQLLAGELPWHEPGEQQEQHSDRGRRRMPRATSTARSTPSPTCQGCGPRSCSRRPTSTTSREYLFFAGAQPSVSRGHAVGRRQPDVAASFGNQNVGTSSAGQTITISNTGTGSASSMTYPAAPDPLQPDRHLRTATLAAGAIVHDHVHVQPDRRRHVHAYVHDHRHGGISVPIALSGTGVAASAPNMSARADVARLRQRHRRHDQPPADHHRVQHRAPAAATNMAYPAAPAKFTKSGTCGGATLNAGHELHGHLHVHADRDGHRQRDLHDHRRRQHDPDLAVGHRRRRRRAQRQRARRRRSPSATSPSARPAPRRPSPCPTRAPPPRPTWPTRRHRPSSASRAPAAARRSPRAQAARSSSRYTPTAAGHRQRDLHDHRRRRDASPIALSGTGAAAAAPNLSARPDVARVRQRHGRHDQRARRPSPSPTPAAAAATNMAYPAAPAEFHEVGTPAAAPRSPPARRCTVVFTYTPTAVGTDNADLHDHRRRRTLHDRAVRHRRRRRRAQRHAHPDVARVRQRHRRHDQRAADRHRFQHRRRRRDQHGLSDGTAPNFT